MALIVCIHSFRGGTGKSNTTANIAALMARRGRRVLVVDTDIQSPGVHVIFGLGERGIRHSLNDYLWDECDITDVIHDVTATLGNHVQGKLFLAPASLRAGDIASGLGLAYWDWCIGNGLIGLIAGLVLPPQRGKIRTLADMSRMFLAVVAGNGMGLCFAILVDGVVLHRYGATEALLSWYLPAVVSNVVFGLFILPPALWVARRLIMTVETRICLAITVLLMASVVVATAAVAAGFSHLLAHLPLTAGDSGQRAAATLASLRWTGGLMLAVLLPALGVSLWLVRRITAPLTDLTLSARSLERGEYELPALQTLKRRDDEVGELANAFERMSSSVQQRESALKRQISELRIEIDRESESREVRTITETEYFRTLEERAKELRRKRTRQPPAAPAAEQKDS